MAEVHATVAAVHGIAAALQPLGKAVIINAGARLFSQRGRSLLLRLLNTSTMGDLRSWRRSLWTFVQR